MCALSSHKWRRGLLLLGWCGLCWSMRAHWKYMGMHVVCRQQHARSCVNLHARRTCRWLKPDHVGGLSVCLAQLNRACSFTPSIAEFPPWPEQGDHYLWTGWERGPCVPHGHWPCQWWPWKCAASHPKGAGLGRWARGRTWVVVSAWASLTGWHKECAGTCQEQMLRQQARTLRSCTGFEWRPHIKIAALPIHLLPWQRTLCVCRHSTTHLQACSKDAT